MNWIILLQLLPLIISLIKIAESILGDRTGTKKKAFVVDGIEQIMKAMPSVSTGAQKNLGKRSITQCQQLKILLMCWQEYFFQRRDDG